MYSSQRRLYCTRRAVLLRDWDHTSTVTRITAVGRRKVYDRITASFRPARLDRGEAAVSIQTVSTSINIEWDDGAVMIFSFSDQGTTYYCGFVHQIGALQVQTGTQTQSKINPDVQYLQQQAFQVTLDPQTWVETAKFAHRDQKNNKLLIVYDDTTNFNYTTVTTKSFQLQAVYSVTG